MKTKNPNNNISNVICSHNYSDIDIDSSNK